MAARCWSGVLNTLLVAVLGIVLSTVLGTAIGIARLSRQLAAWRQLALAYVETFRNVPLLLQLIVWWDLLRVSAPPPRQAWQPLPDVFVSDARHRLSGAGLVAGLSLRWAWRSWRRCRGGAAWWRGGARGKKRAAALARILPLAVFLVGGAPSPGTVRSLQGLQFQRRAYAVAGVRGAARRAHRLYRRLHRGDRAQRHRGREPRPERGGAALGLNRRQALRLVILPQALRIVIPPILASTSR